MSRASSGVLPATLPPCRAPQIRATITGNDGAGGHAASYVMIYNPSNVGCRVKGPPVLRSRDRGGAIVARSRGRKPFMAYPRVVPRALAVDAGSSRRDWDERGRRVVSVVIAQGDCPGGVFPSGSRLEVVLPGTGVIEIAGFTGDLPFDYRCDLASPPAAGTPQLLIGDLWGPEDLPS